LLSYKEEYIGKRVRKYYYLTRKGQKEKAIYLEQLKDFLETMNKIVFPKINPA
jgi:PadR family transcriptional regulator, regulatory protein PadR